MRVSLIVAMAAGGVIGRGGELPWRLPADLARFKRLTMGHAIIMGRKTWESIGRPLPGRAMIVVTRQPDYTAEGVHVAHSLDEALAASQANQSLAASQPESEVFIIGGAEIYRQALPRADRLYLTRVQADVVGDVYFPEVNWSHWQLREAHPRPADAKNEFPVTFEVYERIFYLHSAPPIH